MTFDRLPAAGRRAPGVRSVVLAACAFAALAGCTSPPSRFYTLSPADDASRTVATVANPPWLIALAPVDVPPQVAKNQFVVQTSANEVNVLEQERWIALPGDEIRRALSGDLTQQLGTIDVYGTPHPQGVPVYRVSVNVQRFESWPGSHALIDAVWSVRSLRTDTVMTCRTVANEPVGGGYASLVEGHRRAVDALATSIASGVRTLASMPVTSVTPAVSAAPPASTGTKGHAAAKGARSTSVAQPAATSLPCPSPEPASAGAMPAPAAG